MKKMILFLMLVFLAVNVYADFPSDIVTNRSYMFSLGVYDPFLKWARLVDDQMAGSIGTGEIFYVDSGVAAEGDGSSWTNAKNTLDEGINLCTANRGDIIYVAQGHAENIATAAAISADCAGITIIGCGTGDDMPELSFTAQASTFSISAADVTVSGIRFLGAFTSGTTIGVSITADGDGASIIGNEFRETTNDKELLIMINAAAAADRLNIIGNSFVGATGGTDSSSIVLAGASNKTVIADNWFDGDWSDYVIKASGATSVQMLIQDNVIANFDTTQGYIMTFAAASTGDIINNKCYGNGASFAIIGNAMFVSPDNVTMGTENVETRNYESMFGAYTGAGAASATDNIAQDFVLAQTDLDGILADTALWDTTAELQTILFGSATAGATQAQASKIDGATVATSPTAGSLAAFIASGGTGLGTQLAVNKSIIDAIGTNGTTIADTATGLAGIIGVPTDADNVVDSSTIAANRDGSVLERLEEINKFLETGTLDKLTGPSNTFSILDILGSDGLTTTAAVAGSLLGAIGTNEAASATPFTSTAVESDPDGSVVERQEYIQKLHEILTAEQLRSIAGSAMPLAVWYVDPAAAGTGDGKSPANAFTTLTLAIAACSNAVDDWVLVFDYSGGEASTITINKAFVHFIGMGAKGMPYPRIKPNGNFAGITFTDAGDHVEIANMVIGAGTNGYDCISFAGCTGGAYGNYIHDCIIGRDVDAPGNDGISVPAGADAPYLVVENCRFTGTVMSGLDQSGIDIAGQCTGGSIMNNFFQDIGSSTNPAINISGNAGPMQIEGNRIAGNDDTAAGWGITLSAGCSNIWVDNNRCGSSDAAPDASGWLDSAADEANAWGNNYVGIVATLP
jgi:hypothetical protein